MMMLDRRAAARFSGDMFELQGDQLNGCFLDSKMAVREEGGGLLLLAN